MQALSTVAPAFVEIAHRVVWATMATVDTAGRPRSRTVHPVWDWDGERVTGWVGALVTPSKQTHLQSTPYASLNYWDPRQDVVTAECRAELLLDDESCIRVWERFKALDPPLGYDGTDIPMWSEGPTCPAFGALRLDPWRLRVFPAIYGATNGAQGAILTWREDALQG